LVGGVTIVGGSGGGFFVAAGVAEGVAGRVVVAVRFPDSHMANGK
jgi:hypothetical protein